MLRARGTLRSEGGGVSSTAWGLGRGSAGSVRVTPSLPLLPYRGSAHSVSSPHEMTIPTHTTPCRPPAAPTLTTITSYLNASNPTPISVSSATPPNIKTLLHCPPTAPGIKPEASTLSKVLMSGSSPLCSRLLHPDSQIP